MTMKSLPICLTVAVCLCLTGCATDPKSEKGFTLPDGDATRGQTVFIDLSCHECHTVSGVKLPELDEPAESIVRLGGEVGRIKTYGELVTSIINPSHKLATGYKREDIAEGGESKMTNYNSVMTVDQLIDLVAFLQSHYKLKPYEPSDYPMYY